MIANTSIRIHVTALSITLLSVVRALSPLPGTPMANAHHNPLNALDTGEIQVATATIEPIASQNDNSDDNNSQPPGSSRR